MAQRLMDIQGRCGADYDETSPERTNSRNGDCERHWDTRAGSVTLKVSKQRQGSEVPEFLERKRTAEKVLTAFIQETKNPGYFHLLGGQSGQGSWHVRRLDLQHRLVCNVF